MDDAGGRDDSAPLDKKRREFLDSFFKKGAAFTHELLRENDRMRRHIVGLEQQIASMNQPGPSQQTLDDLIEKIHTLEEERRVLREQFSKIDAIEDRLDERYEEIERENNDLASLYVAKTQLHASLELRDVVQVVVEILLNFCGASRFAVMLLSEQGTLSPIAAEGMALDEVPSCDADEGRVAEALAKRRPTVPATIDGQPEASPLVIIPLRCGDELLGSVVVWAFLQQKQELWPVDRRIFSLLHDSAGLALESARLATAGRSSGDIAKAGRFEQYAALLR